MLFEHSSLVMFPLSLNQTVFTSRGREGQRVNKEHRALFWLHRESGGSSQMFLPSMISSSRQEELDNKAGHGARRHRLGFKIIAATFATT